MSSNMDEADGSARPTTRRSLRRMPSCDSLSESEAPALRTTRRISQLTAVKEGSPAVSLASPRRTRRTSEDSTSAVTSSPFRRTTRASSQEQEIAASPLPTRASRRINQFESDDDADSPGRSKKAQSKRRQSTIAAPTVEQIIEEAEDEADTGNAADSTVMMNQDELELRNRSITKSPSVTSPAKSSLNGSKMIEDFVLDSSKEEDGEKANKIFKTRNMCGQEEETELKQVRSANDSILESPKIEPYASNRKTALKHQNAVYDSVMQELKEKQSEVSEDPKDEESGDEEVFTSVPITQVCGRRSIHSGSDLSEEAKTPLKTPKSARKSEVSSASKTPKSAKKIDEVSSISKTPKSAKKVDEALSVCKTPKSAKKDEQPTITKTPKNAKRVEIIEMVIDNDPTSPSSTRKSIKNRPKTPRRSEIIKEDDDDSDDNMKISKSDSDMEICSESPKQIDFNKSSRTILGAISVESSAAMSIESSSSLKSYIDRVAESSQRLKVRKSAPAASVELEECFKLGGNNNRSWSMSVTQKADHAIDRWTLKTTSPVVIHASPGKKREKSISSDESDDEHEKNSFVNDECEVGEEESITESERLYIEQNEVEDHGESIGSRDSDENEIASEEEDEEADDESFIDNDHVSDAYSMDSDEEMIEKTPEKQKRKSRIIPVSSSDEDDTVQILPDLAILEQKETSPSTETTVEETNIQEEKQKKSRKSLSLAVEQEEVDIELPKSKIMKRKRDENELDQSIAVASKRARLSLNESLKENGIATLFKESTDESESESEAETMVPVKSKKVQSSDPNLHHKVINKCEEYMSKYEEEKKAKLALKRERKAKKLEKKQQEADAEKAAEKALNSSNGSTDKENVPKKKNKSKIKKQKLVDLPEKRNDMAAAISKEQERLEKKRQRKMEKKLAKQEKELQSNPEHSKKTAKAKKTHGEVPQPESRKLKSVQEPAESGISKKKKLVEVTAEEPIILKKKKKTAVPEEVPAVEAKTKKSKKQKEIQVEIPDQEQPEKKKSKKRKLAETLSDDVEQVPKPKKLNILQQIENPDQYQEQNCKSRRNEEPVPAMPLMSQKLKKVVQPTVDKVKKNKKKNRLENKIPEPMICLPRPVWTTAGTFMEDPASPYKFTSTKYVPINSGASCPTKFGVVAFDAKKKKSAQQPQPAADFRSQAIARTMKQRDPSMKNYRGLLGKQHTF